MRHKSQQLAGAPDLFMTVSVQDLMACTSIKQGSDSGGRAENAKLKCDMPYEYP